MTVTRWGDQGCVRCRGAWERAEPLALVGVIADAHETWYRCPECGTFWRDTERYAVACSDEEAVARFGDEVLGTPG